MVKKTGKNNSLILSEAQGQISEELTYQAKLRSAASGAVKETDVEEVVKGIVTRAKAGHQKSIDHLFDYLLGAKRPVHLTQNNHFEGGPPSGELDGVPGSNERIDSLADGAA